MLQTDAKKRITIKDLLVHPWLLDGYDRPIKWQSKYHGSELDSAIVEEMAAYKLTSTNNLSERLKKWDYDYNTATYMLMFEKKQKGLAFKLTPGNSPQVSEYMTPKRNLLKEIDSNQTNGSNNTSPMKSNSLKDSPRGLHNSLEGKHNMKISRIFCHSDLT